MTINGISDDGKQREAITDAMRFTASMELSPGADFFELTGFLVAGEFT
jgi:hypothetical protein